MRRHADMRFLHKQTGVYLREGAKRYASNGLLLIK